MVITFGEMFGKDSGHGSRVVETRILTWIDGSWYMIVYDW